MTISPFELYMILKLDDIRNLLSAFGAVFFISCIISATLLAVWFLTSMDDLDDISFRSVWRMIKKIFPILFAAFFVIMLLRAAIPTTRQMAAILVVPAIVNPEFMQKDLPADLREIYTLAKEGMFKALTDEKGEGEEK